MKCIYDLRDHFKKYDNLTSITREDFEAHFRKTKERIEFTFQGWDGHSYNGETRTAHIYRTDIEGFEEARFIKVGKSIHYIVEDSNVLEVATGKCHKTVSWLVDVRRGGTTKC